MTKHAAFNVGMITLLAILSGCASWDPEVFFPEDYQTTYTKVHACQKSTHPGEQYVVTWVSPEGAEKFNAGQSPLPENTVIVKSQYNDAKCTDQARYTVMKKGPADSAPDRADWLWQRVSDSGQVESCCDGADGCVGCHSPCAATNYVCQSKAGGGN